MNAVDSPSRSPSRASLAPWPTRPHSHAAPASQRPVPFSLAEARGLVSDLFEPKPAVYWTDLLLTTAVITATYPCVSRLGHPLAQAAAFVACCLAIHRASIFNHELVHFRRGAFRGFRIAWNLLVGIPFLMPSFTYFTHLAHHARKHYGTAEDGEYLALGSSRPWAIVLFVLASFVYPLAAVIRFGVLTPLAWAHPKIRAWVQRHVSSMVIDPRYVRPLPTRDEYRVWIVQEAACLGVVWGVGWLLLRGRLPWFFLLQAYATGVTVLMLNAFRTLGAHRYQYRGDQQLTFTDQLVDSLNYPKNGWLTELWAPVGLRFHALHHLFPSMPYHNLAEAHRRLMAGLPADSPYRDTECPSLWRAIADLWRRASAVEHGRATAAEPMGAAAPISMNSRSTVW